MSDLIGTIAKQALKQGLLALLVLALTSPAGQVFAGHDGDEEHGSHHQVMKKVIKVKRDGDSEPTVVVITHDSDDPDGPNVEIHGDHATLDEGKGVVIVGDSVISLDQKRGFLGVEFIQLNQQLLDHYGVAQSSGVLLSSVVESSPAERAGLEVGDILTAIDGKPIGSQLALAHMIGSKDAGTIVDVEVWRDGRMQTISATLEEQEGFAGIRTIRLHGDCEEDDECDHDFAFTGDDNVFVIRAEDFDGKMKWIGEIDVDVEIDVEEED